MEDNKKRNEKSAKSKKPAPVVVAVQRRGTPLNKSSGLARGSGSKGSEQDTENSIGEQLTVEEKETNFASPENARRACSVISTALNEPNDSLRVRGTKLVGIWLSKGETEWIEAANTPLLFDLTLDYAKTPAIASNLKTIREKTLKAFQNRLRTSRNPVEWLRWLRAAMARGDLQPVDVRQHFDSLLQFIVSVIAKTRHAVSVAPRAASHRKMSELWLNHSTTSVEACNAIQRTPDGLGALCVVQSDIAKKHLLISEAITSPGALALKVVASTLFSAESQEASEVDWFEQTGLVNSSVQDGPRLSLAEGQAWMEVCAFTIRTVSTKNKTSAYTASKAARILLHVFREFGDAYIREFPNPQARKGTEAALAPLVEAFEALRGFGDFALVAELLLAIRSRHILSENPAVQEAFLGVCTSLAEVGLQLLVEQCVRYGSLLLTHSWSLQEGDLLEKMVLSDLDWINATNLTKLLLDGRLMLRLCQACVWPGFCPAISEKCVALTRKFMKATGNIGELPAAWSRVQSILTERFRKPIDIAVPQLVPFNPAVVTPVMQYSEARRLFASSLHTVVLVPTFAKKEFGFANPELTRIARAKRFADAILSLLAVESESSDALDGWREEVARMFWECYLESDSAESSVRRLATSPDPSGDMEADEQEFRAWMSVWACRGLTAATLRSRYGSPKETFQQFEIALEKLKGKQVDDIFGVARLVLDLLWNLHRELLVFAPLHPEIRVATFFQKNVDTCQSWLMRLADISLHVSDQRSFGRGALAPFFFLHYTDSQLTPKPASWTALTLQSLANRQEASCIRALCCYSDIFVTPSSRAWCEAFEVFSQGAYVKAKEEFDHTLELLAMELEGATKLTDDEKWRVRSSREFAVESLLRLGQWEHAKTLLVEPEFPGLPSQELTPDDVRKRENTLRFVEIMLAMDKGERGGVELERIDNDIVRGSPLLAFARWCSEPSSTSASTLLKDACSSAQSGGWREVQELRRFTGGNRSSQASGIESSGEFWSVLESARKKFGLPPDLRETSRMCSRALDAGDLDAATLLLQRMSKPKDPKPDDHQLFLRLACDLRRTKLPGGEAAIDVLAPPNSLARTIVDAEMDPSMFQGKEWEMAEQLNAAEASTLDGKYLFTLGGLARRRGDIELAAKLHYKCLEREPSASSLSHRAFLLFLEETDVSDEVGEYLEDSRSVRDSQLAALPVSVLRRGLSALIARSRCASATSALEKLARDDPRAVVWELVSMDTTASIAAARRAVHPDLLRETELLKSALVEASRTFDEDWEDLFDELQKKPWLERVLNGPKDSAIVARARQLWQETFGAPSSELSAYHRRFMESEAGIKLDTWLHGGRSDYSEFCATRDTLAEWITSQGTKRVFSELCGDRGLGSGTFSVIPGEDDAEFRIEERVDVLRTKTRPRKIGFRLARAGARAIEKTGQTKHFLLKSAEDLRLDQRLVQLWTMVAGHEHVRAYHVVPLSRRVGLIEWVERAVPLFHAYREWKDLSALGTRGAGETGSNLEVEKGERLEVTEQFQQALSRTENKSDRLAAFKEVRGGIDQTLLRRFIWTTSRDPEAWFARSNAFASSSGVTSALGWVVGLGDRHLDNILFELDSGRIVHVDLNVCFDKGLRLRVPETVPFRLTGVMAAAMPFAASARRRVNLEKGPFGAAMVQTVQAIREHREEVLAFLSAFVFDPIRPQSSTSRVGLLDLDRAEFNALKELFLHEADAWLSDPLVAEARVVEDDEDGPESEIVQQDEEQEPPRLVLERAKAAVHRAQADCTRQKDRAVTSFARVQNGDRILRKAAELTEDDCAGMPENVRRATSQLAKAESLCAQIGAQSLGRAVDVFRRFTTLSRLALPCSLWSDRLGDLLRRTAEGTIASGAGRTEVTSSAEGFAPSEISTEDLANLESFKVVVQSMVDTSAPNNLGSLSDPRALSLAQKLDRVQRKVTDFIALADAVISLVQDARDSCEAAKLAARNLKRAMARAKGIAVKPLLQSACERAPDCGLFLSVCIQLRLKERISALTQYQELAGTPGGMKPRTLALAARWLEEAVSAAPQLEFIATEQDGKAELQAKQANARVRVRVDDPADATKLVGQLIEQATSEKNLSEMWIGWMPFI